MRQILVLSSADADLCKIQTYTREMWGGLKVIELQSIVDTTLGLLAFSPFVGRKINKRDAYALVLGKLPFVMIYKVDDEFVRIIQVIHTKRNR